MLDYKLIYIFLLITENTPLMPNQKCYSSECTILLWLRNRRPEFDSDYEKCFIFVVILTMKVVTL